MPEIVPAAHSVFIIRIDAMRRRLCTYRAANETERPVSAAFGSGDRSFIIYYRYICGRG